MKNLLREIEVEKYTNQNTLDDKCQVITNKLITENSLKLFVDGKEMFIFNCNVFELEELAVGRLISEGIIESYDDIKSISFEQDGSQIKVIKNKKSYVNRPEYDKIEFNDIKDSIFDILAVVNETQKIHRITSGTHSCTAIYEGKVLQTFEDIGRHNAMDKAIGYLAMNGYKLERCFLYYTGRVVTDTVRKLGISNIPILITKSVPTYDAVVLAREYGITLVCRAWPDSYERYK